MSYFKIDSSENFTEWKKMPNFWEKIEIQAKILPDRNFIQDMLAENSPYWDVLTEPEFQHFLRTI